MLKCLAGAALALILLIRPEAAANGAREAMRQWYDVVAPSLFPFMALLPLLTGDAWEPILGGLTRRVYRLPGAAASALAVGMLAGSPAGCAAARRVPGLTRGQFQRLAIASCGLSPAFFISGVGAAMLGSPACGLVLLRSQLATQLLMPLLLIPFCRDDTPVEAVKDLSAAPPVGAILNVCGYMVLFGALSAALGGLMGELWGRACLTLMDVTSGARILSALNLPLRTRMMALSGLTGFGGLCVCAQNLSIIKENIHPLGFIAARIAAGLVAAGLTALQSCDFSVNIRLPSLPVSCLCACLLALPVVFKLKRTIS